MTPRFDYGRFMTTDNDLSNVIEGAKRTGKGIYMAVL